MGVTTLDLVRASTFVSEVSGTDPREVRVPVIGGHSGVTIIPLLSQVKPSYTFTQDQIETLTNRIQFGGDEVVKAKDGSGSATLSMAHAAARFATRILDASIKKVPGIIECCYVNLDADKECGVKIRNTTENLEYFSVNVELSPEGISKIYPIENLTGYEEKLLKEAIPELRGNINKGITFISEDSKL